MGANVFKNLGNSNMANVEEVASATGVSIFIYADAQVWGGARVEVYVKPISFENRAVDGLDKWQNLKDTDDTTNVVLSENGVTQLSLEGLRNFKIGVKLVSASASTQNVSLDIQL